VSHFVFFTLCFSFPLFCASSLSRIHFKDSKTGTVDISKAAQALGVPKRRIYDITNVLEGSGLTVKKSTNVIAWKSTSSRYIPPGSHAKHSTQEQMQSRISALVEEEAILDRWISRLQRLKESQIPSLQMGAPDIVEALYYPRDGSTPLAQPDVEWDNGGDEFRPIPMHSTIAVHAPFGSFVQLRTQEQKHRLFVATHSDLDDAIISAEGDIRRVEEGAPIGRKKPPSGLNDVNSHSIEVYSLSVERDQDSQTIVSSGIRPVLQSPLAYAGLSLSSKKIYRDFAALEAHEGASDFFG
jgi:E2F/DP family winged-helix DNA-binding domain